MGIYVVNKDVLIKILRDYFPGANDFRTEVIPGIISLGMKDRFCARIRFMHIHKKDIGRTWGASEHSMKPTWKAQGEETWDISRFFDTESPIYTMPRCLPPTKVTDAVIADSVIGEGCILDRCRIKGTVVGIRTRIRDGAVVEDSVIMGSDIYQEDLYKSCTKRMQKEIPIGIGEGCLIRNAIIDKNARIGKRVMIMNKDNVQEGSRETEGYVISGGIVIVLKNAIIPDGSIL
ncbi:hypothetical protein Dimus_028427 [Dionaea muscipula]